MAQAKGFTLLEVLIGAVLIIIGVGSIGLTVISVRRFFKGTEDRSRAMRLASAKLDELLAKGYSALEAPSPPSGDDGDGFNWSVQVSAETATGEKSGITYRIPFKKAEVVVSYTADRGSGGINSIKIKNIRLTNILAYPTMHSQSVKLGVGDNAEVPWVKSKKEKEYAQGCPTDYSFCSSSETDCSDCSPFQYDDATGEGSIVVGSEDSDDDGDGFFLKLENLQWNTKKDIQVIYSIALNVDDKNGEIRSTDTVYTACFLDGAQTGIVTRTPLRSQPSFSNVVVLENVEKDTPHKIEVRWYYANMYKKGGKKHDSAYPAAKISLREAILTLLATERSQ